METDISRLQRASLDRLAGLRRRLGRGDADAPAPQPQEATAGAEKRRAAQERGRRAAAARAARQDRLLTRLGRILIPERDEAAATVPSTPELIEAARLTAGFARLGRGLSEGEPVEAAVLDAVIALYRAEGLRPARLLSEAVGNLPGGDAARELSRLWLAHRRDRWALAYESLARLDDADLARFLPLQSVEVCLHLGTAEATARAHGILERTDLMPPSALVGLAGRFLVVPDHDTARRLCQEARGRDLTGLEQQDLRQLELVEEWLEPASAPTAPSGSVRIGVMDYQQPDQSRASTNVGDYVQTLAMLGHLARYSEVTFRGDDGLDTLMTDLQQRVRPELVRSEPAGDVHLSVVHRDYSTHEAFDQPLWAVAFGWHMHSLFGLRHDFPYHPAVRPIFVSFHVNQLDMLTEPALQYLRDHGPVGCRDWTTVDLLLSAGVDAFFTGCLTTTVDTLFGDRPTVGEDGPIGLVDVPDRVAERISGPTQVVTHAGDEYRDSDLVGGVRAAVELLGEYQQRYASLVTSRLHAYLPATTLGVPVDFRPGNPSDVRFEGLSGMRPGSPRLLEMREGIRDLLAEVLPLVVQGADEDTVRARWREVTAPRVAEARARLEAATIPAADRRPDLDDAVQEVRRLARRFGPPAPAEGVTDIALGLDQNLKDQLPVTVEALVAHASGPLRLWVTCRGLDEDYQQWLASAFPEVPITFLPCDGVEYREPARMIAHITLATMDRLLLPELLPDLDRITYVDIDALVLADVCELAGTDLQGLPLAARTSLSTSAEVWRVAGANLSPEEAFALRRMMANRHPFATRTFNAGILVLDLARMRADDFTHVWVPFAEHHGLNDQDTLLAYAGAGRVALDPRWNAWPVVEPLDDPKVIHYLGPVKPWSAIAAPASEPWRVHEEAFRRRLDR